MKVIVERREFENVLKTAISSSTLSPGGLYKMIDKNISNNNIDKNNDTLFFAADINSTNEANKAGGTRH